MNEPTDTSTRRSFWSRLPLAELAPLIALVAMVVLFCFQARNFATAGTITQILDQGAVLAIVATGLTFVLLCAEIDLAVGYLALFAACLCGWLFHQPWAAGLSGLDDAPLWASAVCIAVPIVAVFGLGLVSGLLTAWSRLPSFIITLAMMYIAYGASQTLTEGTRFRVPEILHWLGNGRLFPLDFWQDDPRAFVPVSAVLAAVVMLVAFVVLNYTRFGRYVMMTGGNREAARLSGIATSGIVTASLGISAVCAGLGGLVNAGRLQGVTVDQNADLLLNAVACVVLGGTSLFGGRGGIGRTLVGVLTFTVLTVGLNKMDDINDHARTLVLGLVLMAALLVNGLLSRRGVQY